MKKIYLIGSLANRKIIDLGNKIRRLGYEVFDEWITPGEEADEKLNEYRKRRGLSYKEALRTYAAKQIFTFDKYHLDQADIIILVMPAGKSGHLELGYCAGLSEVFKNYDPPFIKEKKTYVVFDKEPDRIDIMYQFADDIFMSEEELLNAL